MTRKLISSGSTFEPTSLQPGGGPGDWVFVSGTTGFDYATMTISDDVAAQTEQCLKNIAAALEQAGASMRDVVRVDVHRAQCRRFPGLLARAAKAFRHDPSGGHHDRGGVADPRIRIEIEVTALKSDR
jgi:enamine deaminase RidA (YjgF/YER057c/UK114 family)